MATRPRKDTDVIVLRAPRAAIRTIDAYAAKHGISRFGAINEAAKRLKANSRKAS